MKNINILALAVITCSLTACGSGGGGEVASTDEALKTCGGTSEECAGQNSQVWVWDEENYDSFAHQQMAEVLEEWHIETLERFEGTTGFIGEGSRTKVELVDVWVARYNENYASFMSGIKPYILNVYEDYATSTNPEQYIKNSLEAIDEIRGRFIDQYDMFFSPKFEEYPEAKEHLASLELLSPYFSTLDTISVEISAEIN